MTPARCTAEQSNQPAKKRKVTLHPPTSRSTSTTTPSRDHTIRSSRSSTSIGRDTYIAEDDAEVEEREEDDSLHEIIMALDMRNRDTVGCCYYVAREGKLYIMGDVKFGGVPVIESCEMIHLISDGVTLNKA